MSNPLELREAALHALRGLQKGAHPVDAGEPIWAWLEDLGLVVRRQVRGAEGSLTITATLTSLGQSYPTG